MSSPQDLVAKSGFFTGLHSGMGIAAKVMVVVFVVFTALNVEFANGIYSAVRGWIEHTLNWYYISAVTLMLLVCFYLMLSRFGSIKLGDDDSKPENDDSKPENDDGNNLDTPALRGPSDSVASADSNISLASNRTGKGHTRTFFSANSSR